MEFDKNRLKAVQIVGLDLDGTALTKDKRLTERTRRAIDAAMELGVLVLPATGRPVTGIPESFREIPSVRYLLGSNGAAVYDKTKQCFVVHNCMDKETLLKAMDLFSEVDCSFEVYADGIPYIGEYDFSRVDYLVLDPHMRAYVRKTRHVVPDIRSLIQHDICGAEKINMCYPTAEEMKKGALLLEKLPGLIGVSGLPTTLELSAKGVDKGEGLLSLAKLLGIPSDGVLACGDSENDFEMIRKVGIGAAMANAQDEIKAAADWILPYTNDEEGVAWLLEQIVEQKKSERQAIE